MDNPQATKFLSCDIWRSNVSPCLGDAYPSPPISHEALRELQTVCIILLDTKCCDLNDNSLDGICTPSPILGDTA